MLTYEGEQALMQILFQGDDTIVPLSTGNFYIGACNQIPNKSDTLSSITSEPSSAGGYARIAVPRTTIGWPTPSSWTVSGESRILSAVETWTATGADFSAGFDRLFLCNVASGTSGILFGYSGQYSSLISLLTGQSQDLQFSFYP